MWRDDEAESSLTSGGSINDSLNTDVAHEMGTNRRCLTLGQWKTYILLGFYSIPMSWLMVCPVFVAFDPPHSCSPPSNNDSSIIGSGDALDADHPVYSVTVGECSLNETKFDVVNDSLVFNSSRNFRDSCPYGVDFDSNASDTRGLTSIVTDWQLVCDRGFLAEVSTMIFMCGLPVGNLVFTPLADRFGRKWVVLLAGWMSCLLGIVISASNGYIFFCILRFLQAAFQQGAALVSFTLIVEKLEPRQRNVGGIAVNLFWALGMLLLALLGYFIRNWRLLYLAMSLPTLITLAYVWLISESIPWLYAKQVRDIKNNIGPKPRRSPTTTRDYGNTATAAADHRPSRWMSISHLSHLGNLKVVKRIAVVGYLFFVNNLLYYGLSLSTPTLNGNVYFNFFLSGLVELPATLLVVGVISFVGRRILLFVLHILAGLALGGIAFLPEEASSYGPVALFMFGKFIISGSYAVMFLYCQEVFPTIVRSSAVGIVSSLGCIASILAPYAYTLSKISGTIVTNLIFGVTSVIAGFLVLLMPETLNKPLPTTVSDM